MLTKVNGTLDLTGLSGHIYRFTLYTFSSFEDLKEAFRQDFSALYLFTRRIYSGDNAYNHDLIYLGETGDLSSRFNAHHKEFCIKKHGANCIGIYAANSNETLRRKEESDLLFNYDFPCNDINN